MWSSRFIAMTAIAVGLSVVFAVIGYLIAPAIVQWRVGGHGQLVLSDAGAIGRTARATALVFAGPAVIAWVAVLIRRWRGGVEVRAATALLYLAIPLVALIGATLLATWVAQGLVMDVSPNGPQPMLSFEDLGVGTTELQIHFVVALGLWVAVAVRTQRAPRPGPGPG